MNCKHLWRIDEVTVHYRPRATAARRAAYMYNTWDALAVSIVSLPSLLDSLTFSNSASK